MNLFTKLTQMLTHKNTHKKRGGFTTQRYSRFTTKPKNTTRKVKTTVKRISNKSRRVRKTV